MPLVVATLQSSLEALFANPPATHAECAQKWADAMQSYAGAVVPGSTAVAAAASALSSALANAFASPPSATAMEAAFTAFGGALGGGMAGYAAIPPAGPVGFATQFQSHASTHAAAAQGIAGLIDAWMKTGIATLIALPNTAAPWT